MPENEDTKKDIVLTDEQWDAVSELLSAMGLSGTFEVGSARGVKRLWDREEDRPLWTAWALEHLKGLMDRPLFDYGLSDKTIGILETVFPGNEDGS